MDRSALRERRWCPGQQFPEDLLEWGNNFIVSLVLSSVETALSAAAKDQCDRSFTRTTTAILVYCYGRGIYGSYEVASMLAGDPQLLAQFATEPPEFDALRRFRRTHQDLIQRALVLLLRDVWNASYRPNSDPHHSLRTWRASLIGEELTVTPDFEFEAESRIRQAMFHDSMALDD